MSNQPYIDLLNSYISTLNGTISSNEANISATQNAAEIASQSYLDQVAYLQNRNTELSQQVSDLQAIIALLYI